LALLDFSLLKSIASDEGLLNSLDESGVIEKLTDRWPEIGLGVDIKKYGSALIRFMANIAANAPYSAIGLLNRDALNLWFTLRDENVVPDFKDIVLKYGCLLHGEWEMVYIMDAMEVQKNPLWAVSRSEALASGVESKIVKNVFEEVPELMKIGGQMSRIAHGMMGRPDGFWACTPISIFRRLGPVSQHK
jgi:hypothetical protein